MRKYSKLVRRLFIGIIGIYVIFTLVNQQKTLNQYDAESEKLAQQIQEQNNYNSELSKQQEDVNSLEFIEQTAREKLDMYYPNERIYVDNGM
mgnify:FL=1